MIHPRVVGVDQELKMLEGRVEVSSLCAVHHDMNPLRPRVGSCRAFGSAHLRASALEIAQLPVRASQQFTSHPMFWIAIERFVGPHDHVVVPTLIPERDGDQHVSERRRRVALETLQFQLKSTLQSPSASIKSP